MCSWVSLQICGLRLPAPLHAGWCGLAVQEGEYQRFKGLQRSANAHQVTLGLQPPQPEFLVFRKASRVGLELQCQTAPGTAGAREYEIGDAGLGAHSLELSSFAF